MPVHPVKGWERKKKMANAKLFALHANAITAVFLLLFIVAVSSLLLLLLLLLLLVLSSSLLTIINYLRNGPDIEILDGDEMNVIGLTIRF